MKIIKKMLAMVLAASTVFSMAACGGGKEDSSYAPVMDGDTYVLTIYRSRDSGMTDGDRDDEVKAAIEAKFFEDTGTKISLDVQLYTNTQIKDVVSVNFGNPNKNIDAIFHYLSEDAGSSITGYAKDPDATVDLDPVLAQYGQNILAKIAENDTNNLAQRSGYFKSGDEYHRSALASFCKEGGFGILMRKDLMRDVMAETGLNPEDYDITNDGYKSMTVSEFEKVMRAIKADDDNDVSIPVTGAPWDLQRVVATSFGVNAMSGYGLDESGKLVPAQFTPGWSEYVDLMYQWSKDGVWEKESNNTTDDQRQTNFVAGRAAAYLAYPTAEQLINLSRKVYAADSSAELMVIAPFACEDAQGNAIYENGKQVVNGNLKTNRSFYGGIVPYNSGNYEILIKYIDWMYSSVENYELCLYGVKGEDWVDGEDFVYEGQTYKTWRYPDDKADAYLLKPPYTGKYMLLQNINVSNRISGHYNTTEKKWFTSLYFEFPQFGNVEIEGIWQPAATRQYAVIASTLDGEYVDNIRSYAWAGKLSAGKTPTERLADYVAAYRTNATDYLEYVNTQYLESKAYFAEKFKA